MTGPRRIRHRSRTDVAEVVGRNSLRIAGLWLLRIRVRRITQERPVEHVEELRAKSEGHSVANPEHASEPELLGGRAVAIVVTTLEQKSKRERVIGSGGLNRQSAGVAQNPLKLLLLSEVFGGGGGSRTRVRNSSPCRDYVRI